MKYILATTSESGDDYTYFIESSETPTIEEIKTFLLEQGNDVEDGESYENIDYLICIDAQKFKKLKLYTI